MWGQVQLPHSMPSHPAGRVDDSLCQALPLAGWAVTYLRLLFQEGKQLAGKLTCSPSLCESVRSRPLPGTALLCRELFRVFQGQGPMWVKPLSDAA